LWLWFAADVRDTMRKQARKVPMVAESVKNEFPQIRGAFGIRGVIGCIWIDGVVVLGCDGIHTKQNT
jgi:hypothetical protein